MTRVLCFAYAALEIGVGVEVCWPYRGQEKGSVENLVGFVKGSFFKQRRIYDEADLLTQLAEWHHEVNDERPCRATGVVPAVRLVEEQPRLRPLKVHPDNLALRTPVYVGPTGTVVHDTHPYTMPPEAIGISGTLYLYRDRVRIVAGRHEVNHERKFKRGARAWKERTAEGSEMKMEQSGCFLFSRCVMKSRPKTRSRRSLCGAARRASFLVNRFPSRSSPSCSIAPRAGYRRIS